VVEELTIPASEGRNRLTQFLQKNIKLQAPLAIFIDPVLVMYAETHVPLAFNEDDIMQYIKVEQAQLFPTLEESIYVDFLIISETSEVKVIKITACNMNLFSELIFLAKTLKISCAHLSVDCEDLKMLNLLPWRQLEKDASQKRRHKILGVVAISVGLITLSISLFFIKLAKDDKKSEGIIFSHFQRKMIELESAENLNQHYHQLIQRWNFQIENARNQLRVVKILRMVEEQRPENLLLDKIIWNKNNLLLKGRAKDSVMIKSYFSHLKKNAFDGGVKFLGQTSDKKFPFQFEIEGIFESSFLNIK